MTNRDTWLLVLIFVIATLIGGSFYYRNYRNTHTPSPTPTSEPTITQGVSILDSALKKNTGIKWSSAVKSSKNIQSITVQGEERKAVVTSQQAQYEHFEDDTYLTSQGFTADNSLSADGPGSSTWGYKKTQSNATQIILFSYKTTPTTNNPNEPLSFECPCTVELSAFLSNPFVIVTPSISPSVASPSGVLLTVTPTPSVP